MAQNVRTASFSSSHQASVVHLRSHHQLRHRRCSRRQRQGYDRGQRRCRCQGQRLRYEQGKAAAIAAAPSVKPRGGLCCRPAVPNTPLVGIFFKKVSPQLWVSKNAVRVPGHLQDGHMGFREWAACRTVSHQFKNFGHLGWENRPGVHCKSGVGAGCCILLLVGS